MKAAQALQKARLLLTEKAVPDAPTEAEILLRHTIGCDRAKLYLILEEELSAAQEAEYFDLIARRAAREPTAYITGRREFYGLEFKVDSRVLIPRPETEHLVEQVLEAAKAFPETKPLRLAEAGTGSGAVAVTLAKLMPEAVVFASDISDNALGVARDNAGIHGVDRRITFHHGDLLERLDAPVHIVAANLPYIDAAGMKSLPPEIADYEPVGALDGGPDGLEYIRRLCRAAPAAIIPGGYLIMEIGESQGEVLEKYVESIIPDAAISRCRDLAGRERICTVRLPSLSPEPPG